MRSHTIDLWNQLDTAEFQRRRRAYRFFLYSAVPVVAVLVAGFVWVGIAGAVAVGWQLDAHVDAGRVGGPLWFHLLCAFGLGGILGLGGLVGIRSEYRRRPPSAADRVPRSAGERELPGDDAR